MARFVKKRINGIELVGFSLAGEETVITVPEYNVCFDVGRAPRDVIPIDNVCLSHGHMDHAAGVAYYFSQRGFIGTSPGRVIVHRCLAQAIQRLMDVWADIEGHHAPGEVCGVEHLVEVGIRRNLVVRAFDVNHGPGCLGYTLVESRHKLKAELAGKSGPQLVALKRQGVAIEDRTEVSLLTYSGDTALGRFLDLGFVRASQAALIECTFFDRDHVDRARAGRHIHVSDLPRVLEAIPNAQVLLTHVTRRTALQQAKRLLADVLKPADRERVGLFMDRPPRGAVRRPVPNGVAAED